MKNRTIVITISFVVLVSLGVFVGILRKPPMVKAVKVGYQSPNQELKIRSLVNSEADVSPKDKKDFIRENNIGLADSSNQKQQLTKDDNAGLLTAYDDNKPLKYETIHEAAAKGDLADVKRHLARGTAVNERGPNNVMALHAAAIFGQTRVAEFLIKNGAEVNVVTGAVGEGWYTPLEFAAGQGHIEIVKLLIRKGADLTKYGDDAIDLAVKKGHIEIALEIGKRADIKAKDEHGETLLHKVAWGGCTEIVDILIKRGADVNATDKYGQTPLHKAVQQRGGNGTLPEGCIEVAKLLIENGADIDAKDKRGQTPLWEAYARLGRSYPCEAMKVLLKNGADPNIKDSYGKMLLHFAVDRDDSETVELLIMHGADVNAKDRCGKTPLYFATTNGRTSIAELLRKHGATE